MMTTGNHFNIKKNICVVTASRSEYGLLRWIIDELYHSSYFELQLVVTGSHLSPEQGLTYKQIEYDGYPIKKKIEFLLSTCSKVGVAKSMGICSSSFADLFEDIEPDLLLILGDRYELLPIVSTALVMNIPIAHISGGDITEGAIDNQVRNAVTMMSSLHFPGTIASAKNIARMIGHSNNIFSVGEPGLEGFRRTEVILRDELATQLSIDVQKEWILFTLHPETCCKLDDNIKMALDSMNSLSQIKNIEVIITAANADFGGSQMNDIYQKYAKEYHHIHYIHSLGQKRYLSTLSQVICMIGNTSSGIVEAPYLGTPVINIGNRQKGRHFCNNILNINSGDCSLLFDQITKLPKRFKPDYYYGDGNTANKIIEHLIDFFK